MLRDLITWVLNTYLGKYLENLNSAQLSVALLSGEVELENVPIRKDALRSLGLPIEVSSGSIGKIKLHVPVRQFRTSPWCISVEGLFCVVCPKDFENWDDVKEKLLDLEYKQSVLDTAEANWRSEKGKQIESYYFSSYNNWLKYGTNMATNIIDNIELKIFDVHFRYEDNVDVGKSKIATGIKIGSLTAQSCDCNWLTGSSKTINNDVNFKIVELKELSVYWDTLYDDIKCQKFSNQELLTKMNATCQNRPHEFVIKPISATARWKREKSPQVIRSKDKPRVSCDLLVPEVIVVLSKVQHDQIQGKLAGIQQIKEICQFRLKRPIVSIKENPRMWWRYVLACHGRELKTRDEKFTTLNENLRYMRLYQTIMLNPNENLTTDDKEFKSYIESDRKVADLMILRRICFDKVFTKGLSIKSDNVQGQRMLFHWFPNWMGWYGTTTPGSPEQDESLQNLEDDILVALEHSLQNQSHLKSDTIFGHFTIELIKGFVILQTEESIYVEMQFNNLSSFLQLNPLLTSYVIGISLGEVYLLDKTNKDSKHCYLIKPQTDRSPAINQTDLKNALTLPNKQDPLFLLQYENDDQSQFRLIIKSKSLDLIYNQDAIDWFLNFITKSDKVRYLKKDKTSMEKEKKFLSSWNQHFVGNEVNRKNWTFEIEVFAPRIIFLENYKKDNSLMILMDFGKFQMIKSDFQKKSTTCFPKPADISTTDDDADNNAKNADDDDDDEEAFMTPCSTPPGSEKSGSDSPTIREILHDEMINKNNHLESALHSKIYNTYTINLTNLQVLVCKYQERWQASLKTSSNFHIIDKFNITLTMEQRIVFTSDPEYPSLTLYGTCPMILIHGNEEKIKHFLNIMYPITNNPRLKNETPIQESDAKPQTEESSNLYYEVDGSHHVVQFAIGQLIIEMQSKEKSLAELQIIGARAGFVRAGKETNITMSVHGLLLVDAIQSFGPDFELLVASHRNVGMDSFSGSLKHSNACSPVTPGSPDAYDYHRPTSPHIITKAVQNIQSGASMDRNDESDLNPLINIDMNIIASDSKRSLYIHTSKISFNTLEIIANQETILELLNFAERIFRRQKRFEKVRANTTKGPALEAKESDGSVENNSQHEVIFDFYRLNILILYTIKRDKFEIARKVGTLTVSEAKINVAMQSSLAITGSLGGIQIIDITPQGVRFQRILSIGRDPASEENRQSVINQLSNEIYLNNVEDEKCDQIDALSFTNLWSDNNAIAFHVRMASVSYTHSPRFLQDFNFCIMNFKQGLSDFLTSIGNKATDMAKEFVQQIKDVNYQTNPPQQNTCDQKSTISLDVIISSPIIVLPISNDSKEVFIANLGKISIRNNDINQKLANIEENATVNYVIEVKNINLFSLNINEQTEDWTYTLPIASKMYENKRDAYPILHDTAISLNVYTEYSDEMNGERQIQTILVEGSMVETLKVTLYRKQYKNILEAVKNATNFSNNISSENVKPHIKSANVSNGNANEIQRIKTTIKFSVPVLEINLQNESHEPLVNVTFKDFFVKHRIRGSDEDLKVVLNSVLMEDLKSDMSSPFRNMVTSINLEKIYQRRGQTSSSCPDLPSLCSKQKILSTSISNLCEHIKQKDCEHHKNSHSKDKSARKTNNLVIYRSQTRRLPQQLSDRKIETQNSIEFNCLNLAICVDRWYTIFDFFDLFADTEKTQSLADQVDHLSKSSYEFSSKLNVSIRSLNFTPIRNDAVLSRINVSNATFSIIQEATFKAVEGCLGSITVYDLTKFGYIYKERFQTSGTEALNFVYKRRQGDMGTPNSINADAVLWINMSSVHYIHTKRFIVELHLFVKELLQLQTPVIRKLKKHKTDKDQMQSSKIKLCIQAASPVIVLPASYNSNHALIAYLGQFTLKNSFHLASDECIISKKGKAIKTEEEILDVMHIDLVNINLFSAERSVDKLDANYDEEVYLSIANTCFVKGSRLFKESCFLDLQVERNLTTDNIRICPDISVKGTFSKLNATLNIPCYKLIRALLNYNIGEQIDDVYNNSINNAGPSIEAFSALSLFSKNEDNTNVITLLSIRILLEDVSILVVQSTNKLPDFVNEPLACIHFISSQLEIDMLSDGSQDIDLISTNILIVDERQNDGGKNANVFRNILQPSKKETVPKHSAQVEVHCRKRQNLCKYTIMLNDMRVMGILDFLDRLRKFFEEEPLTASAVNRKSTQIVQVDQTQPIDNTVSEYIINVTDSEMIFVEQCNRLDSNAIILKSTTVISYKPNNNSVPLSININHLEIFSCSLDAEDESALSIIDPFTLNIELKNNCLNIVIQKQLNIRLSYIDMKLFLRMISSIPTQTSTPPSVLSKSNSEFEKIAPLLAMGFEVTSCWYAMELNNWRLNDAALWLSQQKRSTIQNPGMELKTAVLEANSISICVIDDCMDADVPLLEISLTKVLLKYKFQANAFEIENVNGNNSAEGDLDTEVALNYYNRRLSGWEPLAEMWQCATKWKYKRTNFDKKKRFEIFVNSKQLFKFNVTSTLIELFHMVSKNWTSDFHSLDNAKNSNFRQRSPFVPFALQNLTGSALLFKPIYAQLGDLSCSDVHQLELIKNWISLQPEEIKTFDFTQKSKLRHIDSHLLNLHQILVQIHGWSLIGPISIDKVGTYFRSTILDSQYEKKTRIIFDISLMGSAQKLIKVMSPLRVINKLDHDIYLKMVLNKNQSDAAAAVTMISPNDQQCVPLKFIDAQLYISHVPCDLKKPKAEDFGFSTDEIKWKDCGHDGIQNVYPCSDANRSVLYTLISISRELSAHKEQHMPGHSITLLPPLMLKNMLCCDLIFNINGCSMGRINAFTSKNIYNISTCEAINLSITLDNFQVSGQLKVPTKHNGTVEIKLKLIDSKNRELHLHISIQCLKGRGMEIYISAPIWIVNKTGLPLIYRQEGTNKIAAGQFDEHETARQVSPLMFSFSDQEGSPNLEVRLGSTFGYNNQWCKSFSMIKNITYRDLRTESGPGCYTIGIRVRRGRGLYACTTFVTLSPRFHLYNKSGHPLEFSQKCNIIHDDVANSRNVISAPIDCNFPFHWTNGDREPLICVRIADVECCCWSKGIPINEVKSLYINIRNEWCEMFFLRLEIISRGATFILLFTDARSLPPPIRIDNFSEVAINFSQKGSKPIWPTPVRSQSSLSYVLDDPLGTKALIMEAPGGNVIEFPISVSNANKTLTYSNFIYIAFHDTFDQFKRDGNKPDEKYQQLVLGVYDKRVIIMEKNSGDRSQLWLMNSNGQLEHEGSTPPIQSNEASAVRLVLDLEKPPNPTEYTALVVRTPNKQRATTQTWRFENGRLMCHANMCVQAPSQKQWLRAGTEAVVGRIKHSSISRDIIPIEQHLVTQKLRPGSGQLEISTKMDGPICTVQICDIKLKTNETFLAPDLLWTSASFNNRQLIDKAKPPPSTEYQINIDLPKGIGISLVTLKPCEEIIFVSLDNIIAEFAESSVEKSIDLNIAYIQIDNQLLDSASQVALHTCTPSVDDSQKKALVLKLRMLPSPNKNALIFKYLTLDVKPCIMNLEEKLILKIASFLGYGKENLQNSFLSCDYKDVEDKRLENNMKRYYFEQFSIGPTQVRLSAFTSSKLPEELQAAKKSLGLTLIKFEDALIELDQYSHKYHFETIDVYLTAIKIHYITQIKWHAASILGSVDFLGNPLGFANDLSEGVSGLIFEGSVKSLVKNVTHGISNSTAKLTETLSDSLGKVVLDDHDNETRQRILELQSNTSSGHLAAGIKGFGFGLLGGVTSIVRHTYDGAHAEGVPGFLTGLGKGLVGTVTKPLIGMLDLASETASAVRETSRDTHRHSPSRKRLPRCVTGAVGGLLPTYSSRQSKGQELLYQINRKKFSEKIIFYEPNLWSDKEKPRLRLLVSTEYVRIFSICDGIPTMVIDCHLGEILSCHPLTTNTGSAPSTSKVTSSYYIEISTNLPKITRPRIRCRTEDCAEAVSRCINYAKSVFDERELSLIKYN